MARHKTAEEKLRAIRGIVEHHQHGSVDGVRMDATTAHAVLTVYDHLGETNRAKLLAMPVHKMVDVSWKCFAKAKAAN